MIKMVETKSKPQVYVEIEDYDDTTDSIIWLIQQRYPQIAQQEILLLDEPPEQKLHSPSFKTLIEQTAKTVFTAVDDQMIFHAGQVEFEGKNELETYTKLQNFTLDKDFLNSFDAEDVFEGYLVTVTKRGVSLSDKQEWLYLIFGIDRNEFKIVAENHCFLTNKKTGKTNPFFI